MKIEWANPGKACDMVSDWGKGDTCLEGVLGRQRAGKEACKGCRQGAAVAGRVYCGGLAGEPGLGLHHVCSQERNSRSETGTEQGSRGSPGAHERVASPGLGSHTNPGTLPLPCRCWVRSPEAHSVLVMGYGGLTSLFNLVVLAWVLRTLHRLKVREKALGTRACRDTVTVLGLTVLLGTTWALAFFSFGVFLLPQLFLFTIFNSFYGGSCGCPGGSPWGCALLVDVDYGRASCPGGDLGLELQTSDKLMRATSPRGRGAALWSAKAPCGLAVARSSCSFALPLWPLTGRDAANYSKASGRPNSPHLKRSLGCGKGPPLLLGCSQ